MKMVLIYYYEYYHCYCHLTLTIPPVFSVGVYRNGRVEIIANDQGNRITPSYVTFTPQGERLIGDAAKNQLTTNPENTLFDAKRLIGRRWNEPSVQKDVKLYPFKVNYTPREIFNGCESRPKPADCNSL